MEKMIVQFKMHSSATATATTSTMCHPYVPMLGRRLACGSRCVHLVGNMWRSGPQVNARVPQCQCQLKHQLTLKKKNSLSSKHN